MLGGRVLAGDTLNVSCGHPAFDLGSLGRPGGGVGVDKLELGVVLLGLGRPLQGEGGRDIGGIMRTTLPVAVSSTTKEAGSSGSSITGSPVALSTRQGAQVWASRNSSS